MKLSINIDVDNDVFTNANGEFNPSKAARELAYRFTNIVTLIDNGRESGHIFDTNGNSVGQWDIK